MYTHPRSARIRKTDTRWTLPWRAEWVALTPSVNDGARGTLITINYTQNVKLNVLFTPRSEISLKNLCIAKGDSKASYHYWRTEDKDYLADTKPFKGPHVLLPNAETIAADEK